MLSSLFLLITSLGAIGTIFGQSPVFPVLEIVGLAGFLSREFTRISKMAKTLLAISILLPLVSLLRGSFDAGLVVTALSRAAFFAFFLTSLNFLQFAAGRSPLVQRSGKVLVMQPPGRRYIVLTFGAAMFSALLNLGTVGLLGTMIAKGVGHGADADSERIAEIRRKRMTLAMMRGFCSLPMWSPITVTIALVTASIPGLTWSQMVIYSAPMAVVHLFVGWGMDRMSYSRRVAADMPATPPALTALFPLMAIVIFVPLLAFGLSRVLGTNLITALLLCLPFVSTGWLMVQNLDGSAAEALRKAGVSLRDGMLPGLSDIRSEVALFSCSAFIGVMVTASVDTVGLGHAILALGLGADTLLIVSAWLVVGLSLIGISPIISVTILAGTLPNLEVLRIDPVTVGIMLLSVWAICVNLTPFSAAVRFSARMIDVQPVQVGLVWNLRFGLAGLVLLSGFLLVFQ